MIHLCPICVTFYTELEDDVLREPCPDCWLKGWRVDDFGTVYFVREKRGVPRFTAYSKARIINATRQ